ncbi:hypothetical protein M885DRAFT_511536 [Pelagophyceae sp. CCMP2097]|nr:hypothetical protein M885DRAFT_511536 [Pelagophyceae sp. CCMP2097]
MGHAAASLVATACAQSSQHAKCEHGRKTVDLPLRLQETHFANSSTDTLGRRASCGTARAAERAASTSRLSTALTACAARKASMMPASTASPAPRASPVPRHSPAPAPCALPPPTATPPPRASAPPRHALPRPAPPRQCPCGVAAASGRPRPRAGGLGAGRSTGVICAVDVGCAAGVGGPL